MFPFDYDRDYLQPEIEEDRRDPDDWYCVNGRWIHYEED